MVKKTLLRVGPGTSLHVEESGRRGKQTVILLHGGPGLPGYMGGLARLLAKDAFVVDYYQRGCCESPSKGPYRMSDHVRDLDALVRLFSNGSKPVVIGHSWGAVLGLAYAAAKRDRAAKVIALGTGPLDPACSERFSATIAARLPYNEFRKAREMKHKLYSGKLSDARRSKLYLDWCSVITPVYSRDPRAFLGQHIEKPDIRSTLATDSDYEKGIASGRLLSSLSRIEQPVAAFHGDYDPIPWQGILPLLSAKIRRCSTHRIADAGHFPWLERKPGPFLSLLKKEISRL